jgi:lipopolysaccharide biosynthesis protein
MRSFKSRKSFVKSATLLSYIFDRGKNLGDFKVDIPFQISIFPQTLLNEATGSSLAITAHIYYADFANEFLSRIRNFPSNTTILVTTSSEDLCAILTNGLSQKFGTFYVKVVPNVGRNFAPLLVEYSKKLLAVDYFIHVHSKKSTHSGEQYGKIWAARLSRPILDFVTVHKIIAAMNLNPRIGIFYADLSGLIRGINYRWGLNAGFARRFSKKHLAGLNIPLKGTFPFPAGGMFLARTEALRPLLDLDWCYSMFEPETGQIEGTAAHAIERLIGATCSARGYEHVLVDDKSGTLEFRVIQYK